MIQVRCVYVGQEMNLAEGQVVQQALRRLWCGTDVQTEARGRSRGRSLALSSFRVGMREEMSVFFF